MSTTILSLTEDQFAEQYPLRCNPLNPHASWGDADSGCLFETHGAEFTFVRQQAPRTVWTLIDGDDGDLYALSGFHWVNRIGYLLSHVPVPEGSEVQVRFPVAEELDLGYAGSEVLP